MDKFKGMPTMTKALIIVAAVMGVIVVGLVIAVLCTGGFSNPLA